MRRAGISVILLAMAATAALAARTEAPDWLETSRRAPMPSLLARTPVVELLSEEMLEVTRSDTRAHVREAFKILTLDGLRSGSLTAHQRLGQDFKLIGGWIVRPDGSVSRFDTKAIVQVDADGSYEFTMNKVNIFHPDEARVGDILAWEYDLRSKAEAYTEYWAFGWTWPTLVSRFGVRLPDGWKQRYVIHNHLDAPSATNDAGYTVWEMRDLPAIKEEPMSPAISDQVPVLVVSYGPAQGEADRRQFDSWQSVGKWYAGLVATQTIADDSIKQTASRVVAGASPGLDSIRAVTRFVQGVRYLNVAVGRSTAEPHPAPQILKNRFGDCEDKTVLTITLLREIGVEAYPVQARTSHIGALAPEFPAPNQFNHAVVAIKAPEGADLPSTIDGGLLGKLIIFDPTDSASGLGDLSHFLQGTLGVVSDQEHGGLVTLPVLPPESSSRDAEVSVSFAPAGGIDVKAKVTYGGQYAAAKRWHYGEVRGEKRKEEISSYLVSHYGNAEVRGFEVAGVESVDDPVVVKLDVSMPLPGRDLGTMRTMATQFLLATRAEILSETERRTPLRVDSGYRETDRTTVEIPAGWTPMSPLPAMEASSEIGDYRIKARREGGTLVVERSLVVRAASVPPSKYGPVKKFLDDIARGDSLAIALEKAP